ncbi:hypothetical protein [Pseudomonas sp.]|uniref:hypothetical protein n=1 Tax=Pseudomonas sp. TaxID=306 RepID=UPI0031DF233D
MARGGAREGAGRPKGSQNKVTADIKAIAQSFGEEAIIGLIELTRNPEAPPAAKVAAWREVLDRGYGKAKQGVELTGEEGGPVETITRIELVAMDVDGTY